jgi:SAM-dependent methyltransferase
MTLPGAAGEVARMLPDSARHDIYDAAGAPVYHRLAADDSTEVAELLRLLRGVQDPVLELACGSGRLTLPLLASGLEVTAMDASPAMIELLEHAVTGSSKLRRRAGRLATLVGDMSDFALAARFGAVVLGTTSITLLGEDRRAACFACVRRHLADGGRFLVSTVDLTGGAIETVSRLPGGTLHEYVDPAAGRRWTSVVLTDEDGAPQEILTSSPRLVPSTTLSAELVRAGLKVVARHPVARGAGAGADGRTHWLLECVA